MSDEKKKIGKEWRRIRNSSQFHDVLLFLVFVVIAAIFWFIIALNDNIVETFNIKFNVQNVPDSVTFITEPPKEIHVTVRDKGTNILRSGVIKDPTINVDFREYARDGIFRLSASDLMAEMKADLGGAAQISSSSIDSVRCYYAVGPGKRVPIEVRANVSPASGYVIEGKPTSIQKSVLIYSYHDEIDTVHRVVTQNLIKKDLSQTSRFKVKLLQIPGVRIIPPAVDVEVKVQPLVNKEVYIEIDPLNVPERNKLILFPNRVPVSYFVPMSHFNDENPSIHVVVDYNDIKTAGGSKIPVRITSAALNLENVVLKADSVEYTVVKQ